MPNNAPIKPTPSATAILLPDPLLEVEVAETLAAEALELPLEATALALELALDAAELALERAELMEEVAAAPLAEEEPEAVEETVSLEGQLLGEVGWRERVC